MTSTAVLGTYLNDHLAGANAGVEMARRLHERAGAGPDAAALGRLAEDIEHDRNELRGLIEQLGEAGHRPVTRSRRPQVGSREWRLAAARRSFTPRS